MWLQIRLGHVIFMTELCMFVIGIPLYFSFIHLLMLFSELHCNAKQLKIFEKTEDSSLCK